MQLKDLSAGSTVTELIKYAMLKRSQVKRVNTRKPPENPLGLSTYLLSDQLVF